MDAPPLPYIAVAESFRLPSGMSFRGTSGVAFNSKGNIFVIHRGLMPLMEFDPDGNGPPCGLFMGADQHIWLAHGHTGQIMKLDLNGKVVGMIAGSGPGKTLGKYGEAHYIAISPRDEIFVADTLNWRVQKYVRE